MAQRLAGVFFLAVGVGVLVCPVRSEAQSKSALHDATDHEPTVGELKAALGPKRGLAPVSTTAQCKLGTRGLAPVSDTVAIKVLFASNSAKLAPATTHGLDMLTAALKDLGSGCFQIEGHTDERGSNTYNKKLSQRRAESVVGYLAEHGVEKERLIAVGYGEERPLCKESDENCWQKNRRVQISNMGYRNPAEQ